MKHLYRSIFPWRITSRGWFCTLSTYLNLLYHVSLLQMSFFIIGMSFVRVAIAYTQYTHTLSFTRHIHVAFILYDNHFDWNINVQGFFFFHILVTLSTFSLRNRVLIYSFNILLWRCQSTVHMLLTAVDGRTKFISYDREWVRESVYIVCCDFVWVVCIAI